MQKEVKYLQGDVEKALALLDTIKVTGIESCSCVVQIRNILCNPVTLNKEEK